MRSLFLILLALLLPPLALAVPVRPNLTVLVDANLMVPAARLGRAYTKMNHTPLTMVVKNAAEAEDEIGQGLEAHVVLTANPELIEHLTEQGLTDVSSTRAVARTQLALVASKGLEVPVQGLSFAAILDATPGVPIYLDAPQSDAGSRARALMHGFAFSTPLTERAEVQESHEALLLALHDMPGLGLMLAADAVGQPDVTVLSVLPDSLSKPVRYHVLVLASESMNDARQFAQFLASPEAQRIFEASGFQGVGN